MAVRPAIALSLSALLLVIACQSGGRTFQVTLSQRDQDPLPVTLTDRTELVLGIAQGEVEPVTVGSDPALRSVADDPNAWVLTWMGGACDRSSTVLFHVLNDAYVLNLAIQGSRSNCPALGVIRALTIRTSSPIPVETITVVGG